MFKGKRLGETGISALYLDVFRDGKNLGERQNMYLLTKLWRVALTEVFYF